MQCPDCDVTMHMDSKGITTCIQCGYSYNQAEQTEYRPKEFSYSNKDVAFEGGKFIPNNHSEREHKLAMDDFTATYNDAGEKLQSTEETLKERGNRYGEFKQHAKLSQHLNSTIVMRLHETGQIHKVESYHLEALTMICHKLARIANGDPTYDDNWRDIAGYAELVVKELNATERG